MPSEVSHSRRTQSLLIISRLLDGRDNVSPFTLLVDSLEQSAKPLIREYLDRAKNSRTTTVFVSFETLRPPRNTNHFIKAHDLSPAALQKELKPFLTSQSTKTLFVLDTIHPLIANSNIPNLPNYLSTFLTLSTSLVACYHSSQPLPSTTSWNSYLPEPLTLVKYLATAILTTHSLGHVLAQKAARDRSVATPVFGLAEHEEGTMQGLGANDPRGMVVQCEMRRKSGREIELWFVLPGHSSSAESIGGVDRKSITRFGLSGSGIVLLDDLPLYQRTADEGVQDGIGDGIQDVSFNLGLTEKQRRDRDGVVLPYFDAQKAGGGSEGGRILYDMGVEDDFDEEEDEI